MLTYEEALRFLNNQLPAFSQVGKNAFKKGLGNIVRLCAGLGNPQNNFPSIHIAGTNGKGSTSHLLAAVLQHCGYKTGLYTSPHLTDIRERIRINGQMVDQSFVIEFVEKTRHLTEEVNPSYFELNVAMAFAAFSTYHVEVAVVETGLGGRLDSTNILNPVLSLITNIGLDHTDILGGTLQEIASEKAGIIKSNVPVIIGESRPETESVFIQNAFSKHAPVYFADTVWDLVAVGNDQQFQHFKAVDQAAKKVISFKTDLLGNFQARNIRLSLAAVTLLRQLGWDLPMAKVWDSFEKVKKLTGLRGRWDWVRKDPNVLLDVAHNAAGIRYLVDNIRSLNLNANDKLHIVLGFVKDKDIGAILDLLPHDAFYHFAQPDVLRALPVAELYEKARRKGLQGEAHASVAEALQSAMTNADKSDTILITGSFFVVGEALAILERLTPPQI